MCGVSHRTIERWEHGLSLPTAAALNVMSKLPLDTVVPRGESLVHQVVASAGFENDAL